MSKKVVQFDKLGKYPDLDRLLGLTETRYTNYTVDTDKYSKYKKCIEDAGKLTSVLDVKYDDPDDPLDDHFMIITMDIDPIGGQEYQDLLKIMGEFDTMSCCQNGDETDIYLQMKDIYGEA